MIDSVIMFDKTHYHITNKMRAHSHELFTLDRARKLIQAYPMRMLIEGLDCEMYLLLNGVTDLEHEVGQLH